MSIASQNISNSHLSATQTSERSVDAKVGLAQSSHSWSKEMDYCAGGILSNWYLRPVAWQLAHCLKETSCRPSHITWIGLALAIVAMAVMIIDPTQGLLAAVFVLISYGLDLADGALARLQNTASAWGGWLDANIDEFWDLGFHFAMAYAAVQLTGESWIWWCFGGFVVGKYLMMYGLMTTPKIAESDPSKLELDQNSDPTKNLDPKNSSSSFGLNLLKVLYHLPANADLRLHLVVLAMILSLWQPHVLTIELAWTALYYNARWMMRYPLVYQHCQQTSNTHK